MKSASDLLDELERRGILVWSEGYQIRFRAPAGVMSPADMDKLRAHKHDLLSLLSRCELFPDTPIRPRSPDALVPLTARQRTFWSHYSGDRMLRLTQPFGMRATGTLNLHALRASVSSLLHRHEALRTRFTIVDGLPTQVIDVVSENCVELIDLSKVVPQDANQEATRLIQQFANEKIRLDAGPLFAAQLFRLTCEEHLLVLRSDHMITDGLSLDMIFREIWEDYKENAKGRSSVFRTPTIQFADYAVWEERTYAAWRKLHESYWRSRLAGAPQTLLPIGRAPDDAYPHDGETLTISFGQTLSASLRDVARQERVPVSLVVLTIYAVTVAQWCESRELLIACISNGRSRPELAATIGWFSHPLYLRLEVPIAFKFRNLLEQARIEFYTAYDHDDLGRVSELVPNCTTAAWFNWIDLFGSFAVEDAWRADDLRVHMVPLRVNTPAGFSNIFSDTGIDIRSRVTYSSSLVTQSAISRWSKDLTSFAQKCVNAYAGRGSCS